ncbi:MAG TPA: response regulator [Dehalococcoidia bacterium]|nr:response regulator [Acidobacteriota bacterium]HUX47787.1 response regulator [Dehalococcoidia bacterium]
MPKQTKILLIDDDPDVHTLVKKILEPKSYDVVCAYDGDEGLRKVVEERPDLIILDVIMPGKHGFEVCRELKTDEKYHFFSNIPVLMLTVYPEEREKMHLSMREGMMMEAEDYLQKPVDPQELVNRVEELLKK